MLTIKDVAARLNVSTSIAYGLVKSGQLICHRIGLGRGTIRVSESDLDAYLDSTRCIAKSETHQSRRRKLRHIRL